MSWTCRSCSLKNVNANDKCADKKCNGLPASDSTTREPDSYDELLVECTRFREYKDIGINLYEYRQYYKSYCERSEQMTPQEQLFADFFAKHTVLVKDMELLELRAYREQLSLIAKEAKAGIYASDEKEKELVKKNNKDKPTGFAKSINGNEEASDAINTIKERQKRLTGKEKLIAGLVKLGYSQADAEKKLTAGVILGKFKESSKLSAAQTNENVNTEVIQEEKKPIFNPFAK